MNKVRWCFPAGHHRHVVIAAAIIKHAKHHDNAIVFMEYLASRLPRTISPAAATSSRQRRDRQPHSSAIGGGLKAETIPLGVVAVYDARCSAGSGRVQIRSPAPPGVTPKGQRWRPGKAGFRGAFWDRTYAGGCVAPPAAPLSSHEHLCPLQAVSRRGFLNQAA
jgi:hypothetical protein